MSDSKTDDVKLSIVIAAWNGVSSLRHCLASLDKQTDKTETEVIVVGNFPIDLSKNEFSLPAKFIVVSDAATVPELRQRGIALANGEIVATLEDHCLFDVHWCAEIKKAHESSFAAIGGSVENASVENALDWAVYFYDYGKFMLPNRSGVVDALSGINVSYKRAALEEISEIYQNGFFETFANEELKKRGHQLFLAPSAIVYHKKNYQLRRAIKHSFHLARSFAGQRADYFSPLKRAFFIAAVAILPIVVLARIATNSFKKGRHFKELAIASPVLVFLMFVWSFGEFCGYLLGEGKSATQWK